MEAVDTVVVIISIRPERQVTGYALGLGRLGRETSPDAAKSRFGLVSEKFAKVSFKSFKAADACRNWSS